MYGRYDRYDDYGYYPPNRDPRAMDPYGRGYGGYPPVDNRGKGIIDDNYYRRVRETVRPYDRGGYVDPIMDRGVPSAYPSPREVPGYGYGYAGSQTASVCEPYQPDMRGRTAPVNTGISVPDYNAELEPIEPANTSREPVTPTRKPDILEIVKELKAKGLKPMPGHERLPLYNEEKYELDIVTNGNFYKFIVIPK